MSAPSNITARAITEKNIGILTSRADIVARSFIGFKDAIKNFTINSGKNKASPSNITKKALIEDIGVIEYQTKNLESALKAYGKLNPIYKEKLNIFINQLHDFEVHMIPRIKFELSKKTPRFFYKATKGNNFDQNLRNNITMRKTRPKNIINTATNKIKKRIEYISIPQLDMVLSDILPERSYSKIHPNSATAAANTEGAAALFGNAEGGRRHTRKRRYTRRN